MIAAIIRWSIRSTALILIAAAAIIGIGIYSVANTPLDAIPDLSDPQVIVYTDYPGQAPQVVEDQVTYPLTTALLAVPNAKVVRGLSMFGVSFVYVIFEDGTDIYWARSRVLEYLDFAQKQLPAGVTPSLGPDATGVGWVFEYAVIGAQRTLAELRTIQDWFVRYQLAQAPGVAEVASVGGFVKQYQVVVDPNKLRAFGIPLSKVIDAVRASNTDVGGSTIEMSEREYMVRGLGYLHGIKDLQQIVLKTDHGTPVLLRDVARVQTGPAERRGLAELNGQGEVAAGIVLQRDGANALDVIKGVKQKIAEIASSLPAGVKILPVYDRSGLIYRAINTLTHTLIEESIIVALVCMIFLMHARSALVAVFMLPIGVLIAFIVMHAIGVTSNIMSLGGIAIAIGAMVDAAIVMIENAHKRLEHASEGETRTQTLVRAAIEVGPSLFFCLLIIAVSFLPVFTLQEQEGRMFKPLAYTYIFSLGGAALLSVTLVPVLMKLFVRGRIMPERKNPLNRALLAIYRPVIDVVLRWRRTAISIALVILAASAYPVLHTGSEFMPTLNEGTLMYMPVSLPSMSITKAAELIQVQDRIIKSFPEVASVFGKAGRADTATDPAPLEMFETIINLKPEDEWPKGMTVDKLISDMNAALQFPGVSNAWTMPIKARIDMLSTGIRTPVGVKVFGSNLDEINKIAHQIEAVVRKVPGTTSAFAERLTGGYYLNIAPSRASLARYGLSVEDVQNVIKTALGGEVVTTAVEGRERFGVIVRYPRAYRDNPQAIAQNVLVTAPDGASIPLGQIAKISIDSGPPSIRTEGSQLVGYVYVDMQGRDLGGYVEDAQRAVQRQVKLPPGYHLEWSGQFEYLQRAEARLATVIPLTLFIIFLLLYFNFRRFTETAIVMLSVPFALTGGFWLVYFMGFNFSVAVAVGFIALAGVAAETGVVMLIYLDNAFREIAEQRKAEGQPLSRNDLYHAIMEGAVARVRPKIMTVAAIIAGLLPILWSTGTGSAVMQRIAIPMVGGMISSTILTLLIIPAIYALVKGRQIGRA
ncbi:MAG: efflux RND transporter permease subunit [Alphaproteobacteria bacterium]|nr:efflux RND transporter permease subunit [Alphaproteobacteria bacterium]MBN9557318.1 efflux RND transporter permease subunit [Alphaproteobacteria bacterium]MBN9566506.1 efflux RND transporter permease subunit [Alphaproteobacteria bacterium]MBN9591061.1 efflux RND transporter permease subunit [Alphaproteobacteria bacterium]MDE2463093.1 efflux RND transporter permease subunit [Alphaproteobacteria bacterium]